MSDLTQEQLAALDIARQMIAAGIPLFLAQPRDTKLGFVLPDAWEQTVPDPTVVDRWRPGMALCALMGHGLDLLDFDPRNGGDVAALNGATPDSYAIAATPSGGMHSFIASLGVGSRDNIYPGIDVKGGYPAGTEGTSGRGFGFIAPTEGVSKVTGQRVAYRWLIPPDLAKLAAGGDTSGAALAEHIRTVKADSGSVAAAIGGPDWWQEFANQREPHSEPAAQRAISEKLTEVVGWKRESGIGFRQTLLRAAMTLGGYVGGGYLPSDVAEAALTEACTAVWGCADGEDLKWIAQGLTDGATRPFPVYSAADELLAAAGEEPSAWTIYSVIGTDPFDPSGTDQELAQDVSMRIKPALRYAGGSWVVRDQVVWYEAPDMADWATSTLARIMPLGNLDAEKGTREHSQAMRRAKFMGSGSAGIEKKLRAIARHPRDPLAVRLEDLDTDHEIIWAGGVPWNIRASADEPAIAEWISWDTPHMRSAFCTPAKIPTPHWDSFLAAVWPDPMVRAWALRVLSIAFTGYADEAVPVLWGPERNGKALDIDTPMLTTAGWSTMGELRAGDEVYGPDGHPARILAAHDVVHGHRCYRVSTTDGRSIIADSEHLWTVRADYSKKDSPWVTKTTQELLDRGIIARVQRGKPSYRYRLPRQCAVISKPVDLPIDPYLFGVWLGDGDSKAAMLTFGDQDATELCANIEESGALIRYKKWDKTAWRVSFMAGDHGDFIRAIKSLNVWGNKHIPTEYLTAGTEQRLALLQGLLDTDGYIDERGSVEFCSVRKDLADGFLYLARSLGWRATCKEGVASIDGRVIGPKWRICFYPKQNDLAPFRLQRRAARVKSAKPTDYRGVVSIESIEEVDSRPVRCIKVNRPDGLYLAGADLLPTHNTSTISFLVKVLGGYAHAADPRLLAGVDNVHASVVYALKGRRLSFIDEGPRPGHLALERLKQLTGGGELTGNAMRANPVTFAPTHTLIMTTNNEPSITDPALRARMRVIPCAGELPVVRAARRALGPVWMTEAPGVLAQMMAEAARWLAEPDTARNEAAPEGVRAVVTDMVRGQDPVADWVDLCTVPATPGDQASVLFRHFCEWFDASAVHRRTSRPTQTAFGRRLTDLGYPAVDLHLAGSPATLRYRPLTVLGGMTGPWVPPPTVAVNTSATPGTRTTETPPQTENPANNSASAEQTRSTKSAGGENANCATANSANEGKTDKGAESGTAEPSASGTVGGQLGGGMVAELSPPENPRSGSTNEIVRDSGDSYSSLPEDRKNTKINIHPLVENSELPGENGKSPPTVPNDHGNGATSAPSTSADPAGTVGGGTAPPAGTSAAASAAGSKSINSDLGAAVAGSITERLLASAYAGKTANPKISLIDQHREQPKPGTKTAKRAKLTPEQKEANRLARLAANAAAREEVRLAKVAELAGPILDLPATVMRGLSPHSVTIAEAMAIVRRATARNGSKTDIDIETNGYPLGHRLHRVQSVQLGDLIEACDFDPHDAEQAEAVKVLVAEAPALGAFSATADLAPLAHMGLIDHESAWERMWDVVHQAKLADPAGAGSDSAEGLKKLSGYLLGADSAAPAAEAAKDALFSAAGWLKTPKPGETPHEKNGWAMVDARCSTMVAYACADVLDTAALAHRLPDPGPALWDRERRFQRLTARITYAGVRIDGELSARLLAEHQSASNAAADIVRGLGIENPASSQQVAARLTALGLPLPRTAPSATYPNGQLSADKEALMGLRADLGLSGDAAVLVDALLDFGSHKNAISTFLKPYVQLCENGDGRARPTIYTMEAKTGRTSSVRPNAQNIPREGGYRAQWIADPGFLQIGADFSGVELRVAAALSQDQHLLDIILKDDAAKAIDPKAKSDIHWKIAIAAYGPGATKSQRYNVKRGVFGRIYGSGIPGIAATLGITVTEAAMIVEILDSMTPGLSRWAQKLRNDVKAGYTQFPTHSGRIIHFRVPHAAPNYAIQGSAREIIVDALLDWEQTQWGRCVGLPVHDEWDCWVPENEADAATSALVECMTRDFRGVPIVAEAAAPSPFWADSV